MKISKNIQFGIIPTGLMFKFKGDSRTWFVKGRNEAFTFAEDKNTKIERSGISFNEMVIVEVNSSGRY